MTYEEAIRAKEYFERRLREGSRNTTAQTINFKLAIEALEKQTPKKPNYVHADEPLCPYCLGVIDDGDTICESCHQLIDWK